MKQVGENVTVKGFTFQYVSINTKVKFKAACASGHLHSNMFLLILSDVKDIAAVVPRFTFQYVSINTMIRCSYLIICHTFTFQYVSINTYTIFTEFVIFIIYIPICFY